MRGILANRPSKDSIAALRAFNRFYTRQIGVLNEYLLDSTFSLTEMRVLYELAHRQSATAAQLCTDLTLDPGYLSRMLQRFEHDRLLVRARSKTDARQIVLSLTAKGRKTFAPLEARSEEQAATILARLGPNQQREMIESMRTIERLLSFRSKLDSQYILRPHRPGDMGWVVHRHGVLYSKEYGYDERFEALTAEIAAHFIRHFDPLRDACWIAERGGEAVGSIFLVKKSKTVAKLRLLLVDPAARGLGIGNRLISECVRFARQAGYKKMVLWTQSELHAARHLYQQAGFKLVARNRHDSWGRHGLVAETWELKL